MPDTEMHQSSALPLGLHRRPCPLACTVGLAGLDSPRHRSSLGKEIGTPSLGQVIHLFIHSFIHSFISFIHSFIYAHRMHNLRKLWCTSAQGCWHQHGVWRRSLCWLDCRPSALSTSGAWRWPGLCLSTRCQQCGRPVLNELKRSMHASAEATPWTKHALISVV